MENKKKFLLVHPEISRTKYNFAGVIDNEPLELEYISAMLKEKGHDVRIWDGQVETVSLSETVKEYAPGFFYVCGRTRQENFMKEYCLAAKQHNPDTVVMIGGVHVQHNYERFYLDYADYIFTGFQILPILQIAEKTAGPEEITGICYRKGKIWVHNEAEPFDIAGLPRADRTYFYEHLDRYRYLELLPCAHVRTAYGCPYRCRFCYRNRLNCGQYTVRDIRDVVEEIARIDCENIYFIDDDFLFDEKRIAEFVRLVKEKNIVKKYVCYGRADFIAKNPLLMRELKEIGFYYILVGLETVKEEYLKNYRKKTDINANIECIRILNETGIHIMGMFITDLDFTRKDFQSLYKWIQNRQIRHVAISIFTPEMGLSVYQEYEERLLTDNPEHWDYLHVVAEPEKLSVKKYYFYYHILIVKLFFRGWRDGIYDFIDYGYYVKSCLKNMFRFGGGRDARGKEKRSKENHSK